MRYAAIQLEDSDKALIESFNFNISFQNITSLSNVYYPAESIGISWVMHINTEIATEIQKKLQRGSDLWNKIQQAGRNVFNW